MMVVIAIIGILFAIVAVISFCAFAAGMDEAGGALLVTIVCGLIALGSYLIYDNHQDAVAASQNAAITRQLKHDGYPAKSVYTDNYGTKHVVLPYKGCTWDYELHKLGSKYTLVRGSGDITASPSVKPNEVGSDNPLTTCASPV